MKLILWTTTGDKVHAGGMMLMCVRACVIRTMCKACNAVNESLRYGFKDEDDLVVGSWP